jgi:hypothetical protein
VAAGKRASKHPPRRRSCSHVPSADAPSGRPQATRQEPDYKAKSGEEPPLSVARRAVAIINVRAVRIRSRRRSERCPLWVCCQASIDEAERAFDTTLEQDLEWLRRADAVRAAPWAGLTACMLTSPSRRSRRGRGVWHTYGGRCRPRASVGRQPSPAPAQDDGGASMPNHRAAIADSTPFYEDIISIVIEYIDGPLRAAVEAPLMLRSLQTRGT